MISPLIKWKHDKDWFVISYSNRDQIKTYDRAVAIDLKENDWSYVAGHVIDGKLIHSMLKTQIQSVLK